MGLRIVLVDDVELVRRLLRTVLADAGHVVVAEADNGRGGVRHTEALRPDVVIIGGSMPVLDGIAATHTIRARCPGVTVIAFSSATAPHVREEFRAAGATHYVDKADLDGLLEAVAAVASRPSSGQPANERPATRTPAADEPLTIVVPRWPALAWTHLALRGALQAGWADQLPAAMIEHSETGDRITLDLSEITAIDHSGVSAIDSCERLARARHAQLEIQDTSPVARRALGDRGTL